MVFPPARDRFLAVLGLVCIAGGCAGNGCSCMGPLPDGFPPDERHANVVQARVSSTGLDFVEANVGAVVGALMPGGLSFPVQSCGSTEFCCSSPCTITIDLTPQPGDPPRLELTPTEPNHLGVLLRARVKSESAMPVKMYGISCDVTIDTEDAGAKSLSVTTNIDFNQDAATGGTTRLDVGAVSIGDLDNGDLHIGGGVLCTVADWIKPLLMGTIRGQFEDQISSTIGDQLCKTCTGPSECAPFATCNGSGVCEISDASGTRCMQELGVSGRLLAASMLGSVTPGLPGGADVYDVAGGYSLANAGGLSLGFLGGALPMDGETQACVPHVPQPAVPAGGIPQSSALLANSRPDGVPFDFGVGVHQYYLNLAAWAFYEGGFLCMAVGTRTVDLLNTSTLSLIIPSVYDLLHGEDAPVILALRPQQAPVITLGAGTFTEAGDIDEPLITVQLDSLDIDFYAFVDQAYERIFTLTADVTIPLGLTVDADGQIVPVIGDMDNAFQNLEARNSQLLAEPADEIARKFPAILSVAMPFLGDALGGFAMPSLLGLEIQIPEGGITSVDGNQVLAVFGNLAMAPGGGKPTRSRTTAEVVSVTVPPTEAFAAMDPAARPVVELALGGEAGDGGRDLEWQVQVDGGLWMPWKRDPRQQISHPGFWLQGRHRLAVRSRKAGRPETTAREPVTLDVIIDTVAPEVTLSARGERLHVEARDRVSPAERMTVAYRVLGGDWLAAGAPPVDLPLGTLDASAFEVSVTDEAGNVGLADGASVYFHGRLPADAAGACGCRAGGRGAGRAASAWLLAAVAAAVLLLRRRRGVLLGLAAAVGLAATPGCNCGGSTSEGPDALPAVEPGPIGRWSDVAASGGRVLVSAYEQELGDLVIAEVDAEGGLSFTPIDGVPSGPVYLDPEGYRGGITDAGEDVGAWTSIAIFGGKGRVSYQDRDRRVLKYAVEGEAGWAAHDVDVDTGGGAVGLYTSLAVDALGVPGIAYVAHAVDVDGGGKKAQLRWIEARNANPGSSADWNAAEVVTEIAIPCAGLCATNQVCVAASDTCAAEETGCASCADGTACVGGACVEVRPDPKTTDLPEGIGLFAAAAWLPGGQPVIAHYDRVNGDLMLSYRDSSGWHTTGLDAGEDGDTGQFANLAVAADGTVHVVYQDAIHDSVNHVTWKDGTVGPIEIIDDGLRQGDRPHPVGWFAAVAVDASGDVAAVYQDSATADLLYARRDAAGAWTRGDLLTGDPGYGFYARMAVDGTRIWVSNYVYDRSTRTPPGELKVVSLP